MCGEGGALHDVMLRVTIGDDSFLGPGKVRLLELIQETGSISAAARRLDMSYRRAWLLVDSLNSAFREPVLAAAVGGRQGGGAALTPFGLEVVERYRRMEERARTAIARDVAALRAKARTGRASAVPRRRLSRPAGARRSPPT
jgi:molybdate transport system regulatory protein